MEDIFIWFGSGFDDELVVVVGLGCDVYWITSEELFWCWDVRIRGGSFMVVVYGIYEFLECFGVCYVYFEFTYYLDNFELELFLLIVVYKYFDLVLCGLELEVKVNGLMMELLFCGDACWMDVLDCYFVWMV